VTGRQRELDGEGAAFGFLLLVLALPLAKLRAAVRAQLVFG
jgi:hypothetical protein